ncbi:hypothetical protein DOTSEDRAFT_35755 [Dothistroma septosporum NZE10]|uniref:Uncharacterized protein n=1 Tax=Dothistroma septosporum (strain NZE10 / CBS 128990) TaxID=675120 RepID=M2Y5I5_DOTSN|nr:hypothetical protein DOTSEDRAFT_35755 [Dothistroma septosporum NZE10]
MAPVCLDSVGFRRGVVIGCWSAHVAPVVTTRTARAARCEPGSNAASQTVNGSRAPSSRRYGANGNHGATAQSVGFNPTRVSDVMSLSGNHGQADLAQFYQSCGTHGFRLHYRTCQPLCCELYPS